MNTPLNGAMEEYIAKDRARFHMPGHKGILPYLDGAARYDLTEIDGCDSLYEASSAIKKTEDAYSKLYGSVSSLMCTGGSTLCIQTMLALAVKSGGKLVISRGCHVSAIHAMALLDLNPAWIFPSYDSRTGLAGPVTAKQITTALNENPDAAAVYITSPDYYGGMADVHAISKVCMDKGIPLLVDNAHGSHLRFFEPSCHPINLGADICCDSLHKTLPVLTGGAMLHIANHQYVPDAKRYMSVFGSTSPSYLVMLSIDRSLEPLSSDFAERLRETAAEVSRLGCLAKDRGFDVPDGRRDPLKLTLGFGAAGQSDSEFLRTIRENGIEPEMVSGGFAVFMASTHTRKSDFDRLERFITALPAGKPLPTAVPEDIRPVAAKSPREAVFSQSVKICLEDAAGRIAAHTVTACPPGIPLVVPGELIDENLAGVLKRYGFSHIDVLQYGQSI